MRWMLAGRRILIFLQRQGGRQCAQGWTENYPQSRILVLPTLPYISQLCLKAEQSAVWLENPWPRILKKSLVERFCRTRSC